MEKLAVDNEHLNRLADITDALIDKLKIDVNFLRDENEDIFDRFSSFNRLMTVHDFIALAIKSHKYSLGCGYLIQQEILLTNKAKKLGWGDPHLESHPFFKQKDDEDTDEDLSDLLDKLLDSLESCVERRKEEKKQGGCHE